MHYELVVNCTSKNFLLPSANLFTTPLQRPSPQILQEPTLPTTLGYTRHQQNLFKTLSPSSSTTASVSLPFGVAYKSVSIPTRRACRVSSSSLSCRVQSFFFKLGISQNKLWPVIMCLPETDFQVGTYLLNLNRLDNLYPRSCDRICGVALSQNLIDACIQKPGVTTLFQLHIAHNIQCLPLANLTLNLSVLGQNLSLTPPRRSTSQVYLSPLPSSIPVGLRELEVASTRASAKVTMENITKTSAIYHITSCADTTSYSGLSNLLNLIPTNRGP